MATKATNTTATGRSTYPQSEPHIPMFSTHHPMIPKLYVMAWKQDMINQKLLIENATLAGIPNVPLEESLYFCKRERLCHSQPNVLTPPPPLRQTGKKPHYSSHFSRYNSSMVTAQRLFQT